ncbi:beta-ketoacyl synthase N-terminal-like domain-containing protein [Cellulomonas shaoxiangyii]|uniref:Beta-ketoacyl-[acyl-carrier-protein] synthase family protein n=1 Tax=Cellulomonas shaoxiangyii TaxID=2566013 RepID=A0A4P7SDY1_9CELL|nr:beta-ketoacyl synthase N-terminal-like domain-containing protein [Cellulomonas shaoxiangyii]QCB92299.1 beta-ketoacyl-[acyl-carrier-protein] synthase family protein [Cellulomonas shaoxiangyii]TGY78195.1 beta-ketoacyl-[acyl-carrier-protein] synthase family protein [Cellulomonas shaoxiangyii]
MTGVVVTGTGALSHAGTSVAGLWAGMVAGDPAPAPVTDPHVDVPALLYGVAGVPTARRRTAQLLVRAADEALAAAGGRAALPTPRRVGVVLGTAMGETGAHERRREGRPDAADPGDLVYGVAAALAEHVAARGPVVSVSNACAASAYAVVEAVDALAAGEVDAVLACGAESFSRVALGCFLRMGAVDATGCRPFARERAGTVFGEGAAVLVLERAEDAAARGATPLARVLGHARSCDADHPTAPAADGAQARRALVAALAAAGTNAASVAAVVPHGTGTAHNDLVESRMLADVLGARVRDVPLYSLKALLGHTGGAAGALATVAAVEILRRGAVPGNVPVGELDPDCPVHLPVGAPTPLGPGVAVVNAYAFGGNNVSLVLAGAA